MVIDEKIIVIYSPQPEVLSINDYILLKLPIGLPHIPRKKKDIKIIHIFNLKEKK